MANWPHGDCRAATAEECDAFATDVAVAMFDAVGAVAVAVEELTVAGVLACDIVGLVHHIADAARIVIAVD